MQLQGILVMLVAALALVGGSAAEDVMSLDSGQRDGTWTVRNANRSVKAAATVPGGIYSDLRASGMLPTDIFYRNNDEDYRWVAKDNWTYTRSFEVTEEMLGKRNVDLVFEGLDTVARITLNGAVLGTTENMFVRFTFPIKDKLLPTNNTLVVDFTSPISAALVRYEEQAKSYPVPPFCVPDEYRGECHANHLRKMQASFAWDWGPAFPSVGIWKGVRLEGFHSATIRGVTTKTEIQGNQRILQIQAFFSTGVAGSTDPVHGQLEANLKLITNHTISKTVTLNPNSLGECNVTVTLELPEEEVQLWWPNGYGAQPLYHLDVTFLSEGGEISHRELAVGFRTIELIQEPVNPANNSQGLTFFLRVNGRNMFAKGSNWIPGSVLPELGADATMVRQLLTSAREVNMNMLRVWGGGVYESDLFYQLADEMGILIWQDFMFACSMYPTTPKFLASVSAEVTHQVMRLQHHVSVALWAGNNENEAALRDNWYGTASEFNLYHADYKLLYVNTMRSLVKELDPLRPYVVSSPSNGLESEQEDFVAQNPYSSLYGDVHHYNYVSDGWDPYNYPRTRFASEYGFQSLPSFETLSAVSEPLDWSVQSEFSQRRQHHPGGYQEIALEIQKHLPLPQDWQTEEAYHTYIYYSQINQAMSTKVETETYRRSRSMLLDTTGEGLTMGALYWQLNDVWQAPSWASIDVSGQWKMLHYYAKDFFAPVIVVPELSPAGRFIVYAVSDLPHDVIQVSLHVSIGRWEQLGLTHLSVANFTLMADSSAEVFSVDLGDFLKDAGCPGAASCFLMNSLWTHDDESSLLSPNNFLLLSPLNQSEGIHVPNITVTSVEGPLKDGQFLLTVTTDQVAAFVWLEATHVAGHFSDNGFLLAKSEQTVYFQPNTVGVTADQLRQAVTITSAMNHA